MFLQAIVVFCAISSTWASEDLSFPPGFKFGVASSAFQVEGAWNVSDKSESIWDRFIRDKPEAISDGSNGEVACDSYNLWRRDIKMIEEVGASFYRFSISWTRLLPTGFPNKISEDGTRYYSDLIDGLLEKGIEPFITLYHWDLPQSLQDLGGWANPDIADWFADYARVVFSLYADRVKTFVTINEPVVVCDVAYLGILAPGVRSPEVGVYLCNKHTLLAHAKAWRIYDEEFRPQYHGKVSMANQLIWFEPETPEDEELAELARQSMAGRYSHAIYSSEGGWPPSIEKLIAEQSLKLGYPRTTLPPFTPEEIQLVIGTSDFYALNHYTSRVIRPAKEGETLGPWPIDAPLMNGKLGGRPTWDHAQSSWFFLNPEGLRLQLAWLKKNYGDINIIITENGYSTDNADGLSDNVRVNFYKTYLKQLLLAIKEDGVNVTGYTAWTLMDNFEWTSGYKSKFGIYEVDFDSANRTRTPRSSAKYYSSIIKANSLDVDTNNL